MSCIDLSLAAPQLPPIFIPGLAFNFSLTLGTLGVTCCTIKFPIWNVPISIPAPGSVFAGIIKAMNAAIILAMSQLDLNLPPCPMNGKTVQV